LRGLGVLARLLDCLALARLILGGGVGLGLRDRRAVIVRLAVVGAIRLGALLLDLTPFLNRRVVVFQIACPPVPSATK
jgi:hypothetical protein